MMDLTPDTLLRLVLGLAGIVVTILGWSLRQNVAAVRATVSASDRKLEAIATDVRQLSATVGTHATDIAVLTHAQDEHDRRIAGLEDRERERAA